MSGPWEQYQSQSAPAERGPWDAYKKADPGLLTRTMKTVSSYTDAPVRAGVGALEQGKGLLGAFSAAKDQFGEDPANAPTGEDLWKNAPSVVKQGLLHAAHIPVSEKAIPAPLGGMWADIATDPKNLIPYGGLLSKAREVAKPALTAVKSALPAKRNIVIKPLLEVLGVSRQALDPAKHADAIGQIDELTNLANGLNKTG